MCGFAAFFEPKRKFSQQLLSSVDKDLFHRGPDSSGKLAEEGIGLVFQKIVNIRSKK